MASFSSLTGQCTDIFSITLAVFKTGYILGTEVNTFVQNEKGYQKKVKFSKPYKYHM